MFNERTQTHLDTEAVAPEGVSEEVRQDNLWQAAWKLWSLLAPEVQAQFPAGQSNLLRSGKIFI